MFVFSIWKKFSFFFQFFRGYARIRNFTTLPIAVSIGDVGCQAFQYYSSGILDTSSCPGIANHAVLLVGYKNAPSGNYWIVKNSYGENWGFDGYVWIAKDKNMMVHIGGSAWYPVAGGKLQLVGYKLYFILQLEITFLLRLLIKNFF